MAAFFERYMKPLEKIDPNDVCAAMIWFVVLQLDFRTYPLLLLYKRSVFKCTLA
jgi:hypothetical protein